MGFGRLQLLVRLPHTQEELSRSWALDAPLAAVEEIWHTLRNSHRARSVIESFNSMLRTHIHAHRGLPDSLLPLIGQNVRPFPRGVHRGQAPFVELGILPQDARSWIERLLHPTAMPEPQTASPEAPAPQQPAAKDAPAA